MRRAQRVIRDARDKGPADRNREPALRLAGNIDGDRAALIGLEITPLVTMMGSLESKVLSTDPRWARALVEQFEAHGVREGSVLAASFSGSFPGLNLAVMAAARALDARVLAISSVTASTWGANEPGFTWPEMGGMIVASGVLPRASVVIGVGGSRDAGRDLSDEGLAIARRIQMSTARELGAEVPGPSSLQEAITGRLECYRRALKGAAPAVYVNVGGSHASLGGAGAPLRHEEGWLRGLPRGARANASVMHHFLSAGTPVLNLLNVKALARLWLGADAAPRREGAA